MHYLEQIGIQKSLFGLYVPIMVHNQGKAMQGIKQSRNMEEGADSEGLEECCLLADSQFLTQSSFLYNQKPPAHMWHHLI